MSMFALEKECPHCKEVVSLGGYSIQLGAECVCPKCQQNFCFGNLDFDTGEILKLTYAQSASASGSLSRINLLLEQQNRMLKDIRLILTIVLLVVPMIGVIVAVAQN